MKRLLKITVMFGIFAIVGLCLTSCMPPTKAVSHEKAVKREVSRVLLAMKEAYERRKIDEFMVRISDKYPKRARFREIVLKDFDSSRDIHISITIDQILVGEKGADLNVHWYRTWTTLQGKGVAKREGKARLMFIFNPIQLLFQTGDKPFGNIDVREGT